MKTEDIMTLEEERYQELLTGNKLSICKKCKYYMKNPEKCSVCEVKANTVVK